MNRITELAGMCKGSVSVYINPHRDGYESVSEYLSRKEIPDSMRQACIKKDTVTVIYMYPTVPNRELVEVIHWHVEGAVGEALKYVR